MISIIVACAPSPDGRLVIGKDGSLPWHLPEDLQRFRKRTTGHTIVMGRRTFESLPVRPLPGRETIVLSKNRAWIPNISSRLADTAASKISVVHDPRDIVSRFLLSWQKVFICGGAEIYEQFLPWCNEIDLTLIGHEVDGNVWFPSTLQDIHEKFIPQFIDCHEKPVAPKEWGDATHLSWRHVIYGRKFDSTGRRFVNASSV